MSWIYFFIDFDFLTLHIWFQNDLFSFLRNWQCTTQNRSVATFKPTISQTSRSSVQLLAREFRLRMRIGSRSDSYHYFRPDFLFPFINFYHIFTKILTTETAVCEDMNKNTRKDKDPFKNNDCSNLDAVHLVCCCAMATGNPNFQQRHAMTHYGNDELVWAVLQASKRPILLCSFNDTLSEISRPDPVCSVESVLTAVPWPLQ